MLFALCLCTNSSTIVTRLHFFYLLWFYSGLVLVFSFYHIYSFSLGLDYLIGAWLKANPHENIKTNTWRSGYASCMINYFTKQFECQKDQSATCVAGLRHFRIESLSPLTFPNLKYQIPYRESQIPVSFPTFPLWHLATRCAFRVNFPGIFLGAGFGFPFRFVFVFGYL